MCVVYHVASFHCHLVSDGLVRTVQSRSSHLTAIVVASRHFHRVGWTVRVSRAFVALSTCRASLVRVIPCSIVRESVSTAGRAAGAAGRGQGNTSERDTAKPASERDTLHGTACGDCERSDRHEHTRFRLRARWYRSPSKEGAARDGRESRARNDCAAVDVDNFLAAQIHHLHVRVRRNKRFSPVLRSSRNLSSRPSRQNTTHHAGCSRHAFLR